MLGAQRRAPRMKWFRTCSVALVFPYPHPERIQPRHSMKVPATEHTPEIHVTCPLPPKFISFLRRAAEIVGSALLAFVAHGACRSLFEWERPWNHMESPSFAFPNAKSKTSMKMYERPSSWEGCWEVVGGGCHKSPTHSQELPK